MNRINDSLQLFTMICSNELLKRVHLVLFLSMCIRSFVETRFADHLGVCLPYASQTKRISYNRNLMPKCLSSDSMCSASFICSLLIYLFRSIPSYGDRPNTYDSVVEYFRTHFVQVHRRNNEEHRVLYTHFTNVVDTGATQGIIRNGKYLIKG